MKLSFMRSLSVRLLAIFILGFFLLLSLLKAGVGHSIRQEIDSLQAMNVLRMTAIIYDFPSRTINYNRAEKLSNRSGLSVHIGTKSGYWSANGETLPLSKLTFVDVPIELPPHRMHKRLSGHPPPVVALARYRGDRFYRVQLPEAELIYEMDAYGDSHRGWHWLLIPFLFLAGLYWAIRRLFSPLTDINQVVQRIGQGDFSARTKVRRKDELGALGEQIDTMAEDIEQLLESKRGLLLGISHELRTPITRAKVALELMPEHDYRTSITEDLNEVEQIIHELTEAEKLSANSALSRQVVAINPLIEQVLQTYFVQQDIRFEPLADDPFINLDEIRVKLLVKNLLSNALQHTPDGRPAPLVSLTLDENFLSIIVTDFGVGIAADDLDKVTEPFYRIDPSRQRRTGGVGLGLYLCKVISLAHGGQLNIKSQTGKDSGTTVTAKIGLND